MSLSGKVFMLVFVMIAAVGFVGFLAYVTTFNAPADVTINSTQEAYYDASQQVNKSINQSLRYGLVTANGGSAFPLFVAIGVMGSALFLLLLAGKKR